MLFLTDQLVLNLKSGDRIEITVIETSSGNVRLGISAPNHAALQKALADVEIMPSQKGEGLVASEPSPRIYGSESLRRRAKR